MLSHDWDFFVVVLILLIVDFFNFNLRLLGLLHVESGLAHLFGLLGSDYIEAFLDGLNRLDRSRLFVKGFLWK